MSFRIPRWDTELCFVTKFGEIGRCKVAERSSGLPRTKKLGLRGTRLSPNFTQNEPIAPKIPWTLSPVDMSTYTEFCPELRIGCALPDLFRKDWFFGPKSNYNINFQPTINKTRSALGRAHVPPTKVFRRLEVKWQLPFVSKIGSN